MQKTTQNKQIERLLHAFKEVRLSARGGLLNNVWGDLYHLNKFLCFSDTEFIKFTEDYKTRVNEYGGHLPFIMREEIQQWDDYYEDSYNE